MSDIRFVAESFLTKHRKIITECDKIRPPVSISVCADRAYKEDRYGDMLNAAVENELTAGTYLGLAGKHGDHIIKCLSPMINRAIFCDDQHGSALSSFYGKLDCKYQANGLNIDTQFVESDLFKLLKSISSYEYYFANPIKILDMDSNRWLREKHIGSLVQVLPRIVKGKMLLAMWNSYGRGRTLVEHKELLSKLQASVSEKLDISEVECESNASYRSQRMSMFFKLFLVKEK